MEIATSVNLGFALLTLFAFLLLLSVGKIEGVLSRLDKRLQDIHQTLQD
jgi:hypothetical protein